MLFVPQAAMELSPADFDAEQAHYMCMPQQCAMMGGWMPMAAPGPCAAVAAGGVASKALAIRNPKTGEVIAPRQAQLKKATPASALSPLEKVRWQAAASLVARRMRKAHWYADHSTFSALNLDGLRSPSAGGVSSLLMDARWSRAPLVPRPTQGSTQKASDMLRPFEQVGKTALSLDAASGKQWERGSTGTTAPPQSDSESASLSGEDATRDVLPGQGLASEAGAMAQSGSADSEASGGEQPMSGSEEAASPIIKRPWVPKRLLAKDSVGNLSNASLTTTSAGGSISRAAFSSTSLLARSDASFDEEEGDDFVVEGAEATISVARLGEFFQKAKQGRMVKTKSPQVPAEPVASRKATEPTVAKSAVLEGRSFLLGYRAVVSSPAPPEISNLVAKVVFVPPTMKGMMGFGRQVSSSSITRQVSCASVASDVPSDRAFFGSKRPTERRTLGHKEQGESPLRPSPKAYRLPGTALPREEEMRRLVQSALNKICPESVSTISEKIAEIKVESADELEHVISLIFKKALSEPHYCETYADLVFSLKSAFPEFENPEGGKPITFKASLLNICQNEFESLPTSLAPTEEELAQFNADELEYRRKKTKDRVLANMKLIGHLFLRQLLSAKVIGSVIQELTLCEDAERTPEEHVIECAVELLMSIGYTMESMPAGKEALSQVCGRLLDLKQRKGQDGRGLYCKRIQFAIQDLLDTRNAGWSRKVFSGVAKTKEEIRLEQERELDAHARGQEVGGGQHIVAGQRPTYLAKDELM